MASDPEDLDYESRAILIRIALVALGLIALLYQGITYTTRGQVAEFGPLKITAQTEKTIPLPPIL